jgi:hypothetical protein
VVKNILDEEAPVFAQVFAMVEHLLSPSTVMLDTPNRRADTNRRTKT